MIVRVIGRFLIPHPRPAKVGKVLYAIYLTSGTRGARPCFARMGKTGGLGMKTFVACVLFAMLAGCGIAKAQQVGTIDSHNQGLMDANLDRIGTKKVESKFSKGVQYIGSQYVVDYPCKGFMCIGDWAA